MSAYNENKRLSDVTNVKAVESRPKKKVKKSRDERWKQVASYLENAESQRVEILVKSLLETLWKQPNGDNAATAITETFLTNAEKDRARKTNLPGLWMLEGPDLGSLIIDEDLQFASFDKYPYYIEQVKCVSSLFPDTVKYEGEITSFGSCQAPFTVEITVDYDLNADIDIIEGKVKVSPKFEKRNSHPDARGRLIYFRAKKYDEESEKVLGFFEGDY